MEHHKEYMTCLNNAVNKVYLLCSTRKTGVPSSVPHETLKLERTFDLIPLITSYGKFNIATPLVIINT